MKLALIITTIRVPEVLRLYRACGPDVRFFVAGDLKSPHREIEALCAEIGNAEYSHLRGSHLYAADNSTLRRNFALLDALRWGADVIITADDDNLAIDAAHFAHFECRFEELFSGLLATGSWFDPGSLLLPPFPHRGMPHAYRLAPPVLRPTTNQKIGVAAGLWLGDPDVDASTRMELRPRVTGIAEITRAGVVVDPRQTWTVFNSQNTAFLRDLAPAMMMLPGVGRYEDIFASLICQRVMRELGYVTHFGLPLVYQERNAHDLLDDLAIETFGMRCVLLFAEWLDNLRFAEGMTVLQLARSIYQEMRHLSWMPEIASRAGLAWCDDLEEFL